MEQPKKDLLLIDEVITRLRSKEWAISASGLNELIERGWFFDGSLHGKDLSQAILRGAIIGNADLRNVNLGKADLYETVLTGANLSGADLSGADLSYVMINEADLKQTVFDGANLYRGFLGDQLSASSFRNSFLQQVILGGDARSACFHNADMRGAQLIHLNMQGADLAGAKLQGAKIENVLFDEETILPDNTKWVPSTDISRFL